MRHRRGLGAALSTVLIASLLTAAPGTSQAGAGQTGASGEGLPRTVTLITGDRITVHARGGISVRPRDNVRFLDYSYQGHHYVIPSDALPLLREDRLDRRLFDLTGLLEAGYDRRDTLPLLITSGARRTTRALTASAQWKTLAAQPGTKIWLDGIRKPALDVTVPQVGAPAAWVAGYTGAVDKSDVLAPSSSRGPRVGDAGVKPEITAPGVNVVAARSKDGLLGIPGELYLSLSGTSMATPHVAAAAAILTQQHPQWTPQQRKATLAGSAQPNATDGPFEQGAGRLDVARAITANVSADPVTVGFGLQTWPHADDPVQTKDLTYRNTGSTDVTLQLALTDTVGGTFSLNTTSVTVPAGGSASVKLTADTRSGSTVGPLGGRIVATGPGGVRVQTPYGVDREEQKYTVQFVQTDRAGNPAEQYLTVAIDLETFKEHWVDDPDGTGEMHLPAGEYFAYSWIDTLEGGELANITQLIWPKLTVAADQTIRMDARTAGAVDVRNPDPAVTPMLVVADGTLVREGGGASTSLAVRSFDELFIGHVGPEAVAGFVSEVQVIWGRKSGEEFDPSLVHTMAWRQEGSVHQGFTKVVRPSELTTIKEHIASAGADLGGITRFPRLSGMTWAVTLSQALPATTTHVINTEVPWSAEFGESIIDPEGFWQPVSNFLDQIRVYEAGRAYHEKFNRAVFGPALPPSPYAPHWVSRVDDEIVIDGGVHGDGQGRAGYTQYDKAQVALYRNGELVGQRPSATGAFRVPAAGARYRAEVSTERGAPFRLSTKVGVVWSFHSSHVDGVQRLPVTAIGFTPPLDDHNTARAGAPQVIPIDVRQQEGSDAKRLNTLTVSVSHDDGATWHDVRVYGLLGHRFILLTNSTTPGFVSLRAKAEDRAGNTVEQTIIRAYEVK